ncbi:HAD family hydrolase [Rhodococcus sp. (in: high G+C Gram-positive bacteria)]|uniref:HAD family hydrolase n=1 Tax=Rhodococcus sp. TaxID=1831 RepID=UPI003BB522EE
MRREAYGGAVTDETPRHADTGRVAAFFDLDKTVIAKSSILAFSRPFFDQGLLNRRTVIENTYAQFLYLLSGADHDQAERMRAYIAAMCEGWDVEQIKSIVAETLHEIVDPLVFQEAADLIADHKLRGHDVVVISASGEEVVGPIAHALGASHSTGSRMRIVDGRYAGELEFYCFGEAKVTAINALAEEYGYDLARSYAYSDSSTDIPMLQSVGNARAVNPDRTLRRTAIENGWPVLTFVKPVPLLRRLSARGRGVLTIAAIASVTALVAGATTYSVLRRRR